MHPSRRADRAHDHARVGERDSQRHDGRLALDRVLRDVRREAVQPETHVDNHGIVIRTPLRRTRELRPVEAGQRGVGLVSPPCERCDDIQHAAGGVRGIRLRASLWRKCEWLVVVADERVLDVGAVRTLDADCVAERLAQTPLAVRGRTVEQLVLYADEESAQPSERDLCQLEDASRLALERRGGRDRLLLLFERAIERVARASLGLVVTPLPPRLEIGEASEPRECAVEG